MPYNGDVLTGVSPEYTTCVCVGERESGSSDPVWVELGSLGFGRCCSYFRFVRQQADLFEPPRVPASAEYADAVLSRTATFYGLRQRESTCGCPRLFGGGGVSPVLQRPHSRECGHTTALADSRERLRGVHFGVTKLRKPATAACHDVPTSILLVAALHRVLHILVVT